MYVWLDLQNTGYGFGNGSLRSLAVLVLRPAEPTPFALSSSVAIWPRMGRSSSSSTTSGEGRLRHQVVGTGVAYISTRPASVAAPGYGVGPERYCNFASTTASSQCRLRQWEPGTVATAARRMVATSEGGGRPSRQSRPEWRWFLKENTQHKQIATISVRSCCPWRWLAQVAASQRR
jgi:hypothetical protein